MSEDDQYLAKCMAAKIPVKTLSQKLGVSEEEIWKRWEGILHESNQIMLSGRADLELSFSQLCSAYQSVGEGLKVVAGALASAATAQEVRKVIAGAKGDVAEALISSFIILRPFRVSETPDPKAVSQAN